MREKRRRGFYERRPPRENPAGRLCEHSDHSPGFTSRWTCDFCPVSFRDNAPPIYPLINIKRVLHNGGREGKLETERERERGLFLSTIIPSNARNRSKRLSLTRRFIDVGIKMYLSRVIRSIPVSIFPSREPPRFDSILPTFDPGEETNMAQRIVFIRDFSSSLSISIRCSAEEEYILY